MKKTILDDLTAKLILQMYQDGSSINTIVNRLGILRRVVIRCISDSGLKVKTKSQIISTKIPELSDRESLNKLYHVDNLSIDQIASKLGTNQQVIKTAFKRLGIKPLSQNIKRISMHTPHSLKDKEVLIDLYINKRMSVNSIADNFNVSDTCVKTMLALHEIKRRSHAEQMGMTTRTREQDLSAKIARNLRSRLSIAVSNNQKVGSAVRDLGCSIEDFKKYIESKWQQGMSWDNYSYTGWHMDHINPLDSFDLMDPEQFKKACHYTNIQPLWSDRNFKKSNKLNVLNRVDLHIVCGPSGSGKSYVCDSLSDDIAYVSYDKTPKEEHMLRIVELANKGNNILYDPFRKPISIMNRYADSFSMHLYVIIEDEQTIVNRLSSRGGTPDLAHIRKAIGKAKRWSKHATFSGTSDEVLNYLRTTLCSS